MKRMKPWVVGVGLCVVASHAVALATITFEEAPLRHLDGPTSDAGLNFLSTFYQSSGVTFAGAHAIRDNFDPDPTYFDQGPYPAMQPATPVNDLTDGTVMGFKALTLDTTGTALPAATFGFSSALQSLSFEYSASVDLVFQAYSGGSAVGGIQTLQLNNPLTSPRAGCSDFVTGKYCNWSGRTLSFANQDVTSIRFLTGYNNTALIDNVTVNYAAQPIPEPSTYALMALGLAGIAAISRRRRRET